MQTQAEFDAELIRVRSLPFDKRGAAFESICGAFTGLQADDRTRCAYLLLEFVDELPETDQAPALLTFGREVMRAVPPATCGEVYAALDERHRHLPEGNRHLAVAGLGYALRELPFSDDGQVRSGDTWIYPTRRDIWCDKAFEQLFDDVKNLAFTPGRAIALAGLAHGTPGLRCHLVAEYAVTVLPPHDALFVLRALEEADRGADLGKYRESVCPLSGPQKQLQKAINKKFVGVDGWVHDALASMDDKLCERIIPEVLRSTHREGDGFKGIAPEMATMHGYGDQTSYSDRMRAAAGIAKEAYQANPAMSREALYQLCALLRGCVAIGQAESSPKSFFDYSRYQLQRTSLTNGNGYLQLLPELGKLTSAGECRAGESYHLPSGAKINFANLSHKPYMKTERNLWLSHPNVRGRVDLPSRTSRDPTQQGEEYAEAVWQAAAWTRYQRGGGATGELFALACLPNGCVLPPIGRSPSLWLMASMLPRQTFVPAFVKCCQDGTWIPLVERLLEVDREVAAAFRTPVIDAGRTTLPSSAVAPRTGGQADPPGMSIPAPAR